MVILFAAQLSQATKVIPFEVEPLKGLLPPREETVEDEILEEFFYQKLSARNWWHETQPKLPKKNLNKNPCVSMIVRVFSLSKDLRLLQIGD